MTEPPIFDGIPGSPQCPTVAGKWRGPCKAPMSLVASSTDKDKHGTWWNAAYVCPRGHAHTARVRIKDMLTSEG